MISNPSVNAIWHRYRLVSPAPITISRAVGPKRVVSVVADSVASASLSVRPGGSACNVTCPDDRSSFRVTSRR
ncbi:hypothetical protein D3C85_770270 [compost metagenome]